MEQIILPMKVHAVKLEYRRRLLEKIVRGHFCVRRGRDSVAITYDPNDPKCTSRNPRILYTSSKRGRKYADAVNRYLKIKKEYQTLYVDWKANYSVEPPRVRFPIRQYYDPHGMNNEYYKAQPENCGKHVSDEPIYSEEGELKSKNELMSTSLLKRMGIPFKYETELYIDEVEKTIIPDFLISFYEIDRCFYLEVLGMNDKFDYFAKTTTKIYDYSRAKYRPGREVIYVFLYDKKHFDEEYFVDQVLTAFNRMIPNSALIWE